METKKLTAKDLMIGDWVTTQCLIPNKKVAVRIIRLDEADELCKYEPIPLTAEVLEKNGLKNYEEYPEYKIKTNEYEIWIIFDEQQNCVHVEKYNKCIPTVYHNEISYVHELQHALRICGINDKEIVL